MDITRRSFLKGVVVCAAGAVSPASALYMVPALPAVRGNNDVLDFQRVPEETTCVYRILWTPILTGEYMVTWTETYIDGTPKERNDLFLVTEIDRVHAIDLAACSVVSVSNVNIKRLTPKKES